MVVRKLRQRFDHVDAMQATGRRGVGDAIDLTNPGHARMQRKRQRREVVGGRCVWCTAWAIDTVVRHAERNGSRSTSLIDVLQVHHPALNCRCDMIYQHQTQAITIGVARQG